MATKRLIDANALVDALTGITFSGWGKDVPHLNQWWHMAVKIKDNFINAINKAPTVHAVEVVHGRWEILGDDYANCTNCGNIFEMRPTPMFFKANNKYCRNCGAKMDGDGNDI